MSLIRLFPLLLSFFLVPLGAQAATGRARVNANAEQVVQAFLALWAHDDGVNDVTVHRLYAPEVTYYGKHFTRKQVLSDKLRFASHWPVRDDKQVPGTLSASCDRKGAVCTLRVLITWRRLTRSQQASFGKAHLSLQFALVEGNRKIVHEAARIL